MKQGSEDHAKFKLLARLLRIPLPYANGIMERLWNKAAQFRPDGAVGRWSNLELAEYCAMPLEFDPDALVEAMINARLLDKTGGPNRLLIHDWPEHCTHFTHNKIARSEGFFATGEAPCLKRLDKRYRQDAESFYGVNAQSGQKSAQSAKVSAQSAKVSAQSKNNIPTTGVGVSAQSGQKSAQSAIQRARPTPTPTPTPTPVAVRTIEKVVDKSENGTATAALSATNGNGARWKLAAAVVQDDFQTTEDAIVFDLVKLAQDTLVGAGGDPSKLTDAVLADALRVARFRGQTSAKGFFKTLPNVIKKWAKPKAKGPTQNA